MGNRYVSELFKSGEEFEEFLQKLDAFKKGVESGEIVIPKALQDSDGKKFQDTYAKKADLTSGAITVKNATKAASADTLSKELPINLGGTNANNRPDAIKNLFCLGYNPIKTEAEDTPANWKRLGTGCAFYDTVAYEGVKLKNMPSQYGTLVSFVHGEEIFQIWKNPHDFITYTRTGNYQTDWLTPFTSEAANAHYDSDGNPIKTTYAKKADLTSGAITVKNATNATQVNNLEITKDANGILKIGDIIIPQKTLLYSGSKAVSSTATQICNVPTNATAVEIYTEKGVFKVPYNYSVEFCCGFDTISPKSFFVFVVTDGMVIGLYRYYHTTGLSDTATAKIYKVYAVIE